MLNILMLPHGNGFSRSDIHKLSNSLPQEAVLCGARWPGMWCEEERMF